MRFYDEFFSCNGEHTFQEFWSDQIKKHYGSPQSQGMGQMQAGTIYANPKVVTDANGYNKQLVIVTTPDGQIVMMEKIVGTQQ